MGIDIHGWVEVRAPADELRPDGLVGTWQALSALWVFVGRNRDVHDMLFGLNGGHLFEPAAPARGLPPDASPYVRQQYEQRVAYPLGFFGWSWLTWAEIAGLDWQERAREWQLHWYRRGADVRWVHDGDIVPEEYQGAGWLYGLQVDLQLGRIRQETDAWGVGDWVCRIEYPTRRMLIDPGWSDLLEYMAMLARDWGSEGVRIVVWFA